MGADMRPTMVQANAKMVTTRSAAASLFCSVFSDDDCPTPKPFATAAKHRPASAGAAAYSEAFAKAVPLGSVTHFQVLAHLRRYDGDAAAAVGKAARKLALAARWAAGEVKADPKRMLARKPVREFLAGLGLTQYSDQLTAAKFEVSCAAQRREGRQ